MSERVITTETLEERARKFAEENDVSYHIAIQVGMQFYLRHGYDIVRESELLGTVEPHLEFAGDPFAPLRAAA